MTPLTNFHSLFEPHIINRGQGYLNSVLQLKNEFGNHWTAFVKGTHRYKVEVELSQNDYGEVFIDKMNCNCEYWDNCKHQVAVLLKLQEKLKTGELNINHKEQTQALQNLLEQSDKQTLINFILQLNQNNPIENEFILFLNKNTKIKTSDTQINKIIQQKISDILTLDDENEWEEFIFDGQLDELTNLLSEFDNEPNHQMIVAIHWVDTILAIYEDIFDEISESIVLCLECLAKHLLNVENYWANWDNCFVELNYQDNEMIENLFILLEDWRQAITRVSYTICPEIERFYFDLHWACGNQTIATDYLDELLVMTEHHNHHDFDKILTIKIQALKALNQPVEHLMKKYLHLPKVFTLKVETLSANGETSHAITLLKERLKTDNNIIWHKKLVEIGQKINDTILIREHSGIVMSANLTLDVDYLNIYKNTFNQNEWQQQKPIIAQQLSNQQKWFVLAEFYDNEKAFDELIILIKMQNNRQYVERYLEILIKQELDWVIAFFISHWQEKIHTLKNRNHYRYFANDIKILMTKIPTAKPIWQAQIELWKTEFVKKRALIEELNQI